MNNWFIWLIAAIWIIGPLVFSAGSIQKLFLGWRIPTTWISAMPSQGWVEVLGKIKGDPIKSLLSKTDCGYWQLEVKEYQSGGRGGGRWKTVYKESSGGFVLDDMTGRIKIQVGKTNVITNNENIQENPDQETKNLLQGIGIKTKGIMGFNKRLRVYERLVMPDEEILVIGKLQKSEAPISITGNDILPQVISNQSRAETNKTLFWQAFRPLILPYLIGIVFLGYFLFIGLR